MILALVVVIALSTYAQSLFGLDLPSGLVRYRVMPLRGYEILLAKDIAFLLVAAILVAPLAPLAGFAGALVAVAVGHHASVLRPLPQMRWRFTGGVIFPSRIFPGISAGGGRRGDCAVECVVSGAGVAARMSRRFGITGASGTI